MAVAAKLGGARKAARLTQEQLAAKSGVSGVTIARVETGVTTLSLGTLDRLAAALSITVPELLQIQVR